MALTVRRSIRIQQKSPEVEAKELQKAIGGKAVQVCVYRYRDSLLEKKKQSPSHKDSNESANVDHVVDQVLQQMYVLRLLKVRRESINFVCGLGA